VASAPGWLAISWLKSPLPASAWLGTFDSKEEAAHAYDATAWWFGLPRRDMNFLDFDSGAEAEMLASQPVLLSQEEKRRHRRVQQRLAITEADDRAMAEWRRNHPEDADY
jgi:hypothetical protein